MLRAFYVEAHGKVLIPLCLKLLHPLLLNCDLQKTVQVPTAVLYNFYHMAEKAWHTSCSVTYLPPNLQLFYTGRT